MRVIEHHPLNTIAVAADDYLIFLAGPIQGASDWQAEARDLLQNYSRPSPDSLHVANPRRYDLTPDDKLDKEGKKQQIAWEKAGLARAGKIGPGAVLFWLEAQDPELPYKKGRAYGQTTRQEFGRAMGWLDFEPAVAVALGIHPDYVGGEDYYRDSADEFEMNVYSDLSTTCINALQQLGIYTDQETRNGEL